LRNTDHCICLVIYVGPETKVHLNHMNVRYKESWLIKQMH